MQNLIRIDPVADSEAARTPMFREGAPGEGPRKPLSVAKVRSTIKALMLSVGESPEQFGAHSLRIGGATALFADGAGEQVIRTMGRWSSDCYRLYVRACFGQTLEWTRRCGSKVVDDVAREYAEVDCF